MQISQQCARSGLRHILATASAVSPACDGDSLLFGIVDAHSLVLFARNALQKTVLCIEYLQHYFGNGICTDDFVTHSVVRANREDVLSFGVRAVIVLIVITGCLHEAEHQQAATGVDKVRFHVS